jgi:hypothetical protein
MAITLMLLSLLVTPSAAVKLRDGDKNNTEEYVFSKVEVK